MAAKKTRKPRPAAPRKAGARRVQAAPHEVGPADASSASAAPEEEARAARGARPAAKGALAARDRVLARLSAAVVLGDRDELLRLRRQARAGEPDRRWREVVLQAHLFAGFPRVVEAYGVLREAGGLGELEPGEVRGEPDQPGRGQVLFEHVYREQAAEIRALLAEGHPDFAAWIEGHAYGRVLARPGLAADRRELCAVAALAALGQDRQLASHARGSVRCGAKESEVHGVLAAIADLIAPERLASAQRVLDRFARD